MDFSIPPNLSVDIQEKLNELIHDYKEENVTKKGYDVKRKQILEQYLTQGNPFLGNKQSVSNIRQNTIRIPGRNQSLSSTFLPMRQTSTFTDVASIVSSVRALKDATSEFPNPMYRVTTVNSASNRDSPVKTHKRHQSAQLSLLSYNILNDSSEYNPMVPLLPRENIINSQTADNFNLKSASLPLILRGRFEHYGKENAMISIDPKGKETFISWEKLYLRAEKVAHELSKKKLYNMDKVVLWYNKDEVIEFSVALLGCFIAGMTAVPASFEAYTLGEIVEIIKLTGSKFILISNECHKRVNNLHSTANNNTIKLIKNNLFESITFLKTDDLGTYSKAKKNTPTFDIPDISYIEFTRTPLGKLSGVVIRHRTLLSQFKILSQILDSRTMPTWKKIDIVKPYDKKRVLTSVNKRSVSRFCVMNTLDPTRSTGLIFGILFNIFTGNLLISVDDRLITRPGIYEGLIDKFRADILINDQLQLKQVVIDYLENAEVMTADRKRHKYDFSCIKCCLTSCSTIDTEVSEMVVHKWLKNLGCIDAPLVYSPMLTLLDFGGIFISTKDQLGGLENFPIHDSKLRLQDELFINREKLKGNVVESSITAMINSSSSFKDYLRIETFGFPISDTLLCVVNPDDSTLVPDLSVGEIWISSRNTVNEFYQLDKINAFVFNAKLNYSKMYSLAINGKNAEPYQRNSVSEKLETIMNICPPDTQFLRTKMMGFVFNGKIYVLSLIEDMFLQNKLVRLPNWAHTSDLSKVKNTPSIPNPDINSLSGTPSSVDWDSKTVSSGSSSNKSAETNSNKRVVQTHYLQQITETVVRTVNTVFEVSAFELNHHKEEHFLVMVIESSLAKKSAINSSDLAVSMVSVANGQNKVLEKKMNDLTDQIYRILWIFHKIKPMCILVVPRGTLPRRYCSLELANSTVEKKFVNGELQSKFTRFQMDNIILDYIPHSSFYNESIFSEHLSNLRRSYIAELSESSNGLSLQDSGIDYRDVSLDTRQRSKKLTDFTSILEVLEWRISSLTNESAYNELGSQLHSGSNGNDLVSLNKMSWKTFEMTLTSFLKKIVGSKTPLNPDDRVIIIAENSIDYVAIILACFYCNFVVIPLPPLQENGIEKDLERLVKLMKCYKVKRVFIDLKMHNLFNNNNNVSRVFKRYKYAFPKITVISKIKRKAGLTLRIFKKTLEDKYHYKPGKKTISSPRVIWINDESSVTEDIHVQMTHSTLMNTCKIFKETLQLSINSPIFSLCSHTKGIGFVMTCLIGIYIGSPTTLFNLENVVSDPKYFLVGIQNQNVKDLYLTMDVFALLMDSSSKMVENLSRSNTDVTSLHSKSSKTHSTKSSKSLSQTSLRSDFMKNVKNLMIPFNGRPEFEKLDYVLSRYQNIFIRKEQINYVYQHQFNPMISLRSYLDVPPIELFLDHISLREGIVKEIQPTAGSEGLRVQDSGVVPVCTNVSIVNPETLLPCLEGEIGEIWCCSEANVFNYTLYGSDGKLTREQFITDQFKSRMKKEADNGLTYLRTGDLGFIKTVEIVNTDGNLIRLSLLYVLGSINETVELLGLTHFVRDLERTVINTHAVITSCIIAKAGGLLVCLIKCKAGFADVYANIVALVVSELLNKNGVILDLCAFVQGGRSNSSISNDWSRDRSLVMSDWFSQKTLIEIQFGINYGENISIYLLSDFEKDDK